MMNTSLRADLVSPSVAVDAASYLNLEPGDECDRLPIRHLLIGSPEAVRLTVHRLHNLGYVAANLWSPAIAPHDERLILTLNPGDVMRVLLRFVNSHD